MKNHLWMACALLSLMISQVNAKDKAIFSLQSPDFTDNAMLAVKFAGEQARNPNCIGENASPTLNWNHPPAGTESFALLVFDPDGANGLGVSHLVAYNIPAGATGFPGNALRDGRGFTGGANSAGTQAWHGPCPPVGLGAHHYLFTLIATDIRTPLPAGLDRAALLARLRGHALGSTTLVGRFGH